MEGLGVPASKRTVVYDGIALEELNPNIPPADFRDRYGIPTDAFTVGLVGLLIPWKGQELFLDAARQLRDAIPELRMLIIGGVPAECTGYAKRLRKRVREEGLDNTITFTGHVSGMPAVYAGLDVAVSASTSPEPLGTMVIETMAIGRPLVAPNHGGAAEMADHGENALLFEPGNADSLAEMILRLYEDRALGHTLGQAARAKALRTFDVATHVAAVERVYTKLLVNPSPAKPTSS
jgi:glycosyltransferase involved in cell wall biosynthesis